jgi:hypothetical protein
MLAAGPGLRGQQTSIAAELTGPGLASPLPPAADKDRTPPPIITAAPNRSTS